MALPPDGSQARIAADGRRVLEVPAGGRVEARAAARPVRIARVHTTTFGDRLVAKFGLPVRGFRDARTHDPGHELTPTRNVLLRGYAGGFAAGGQSGTAQGKGGGSGSADPDA